MAAEYGHAWHGRTAPPTRLTRRVFARRSSTWLLAGGALAVMTACGAPAASQADLAALRSEVEELKAAQGPLLAEEGHGAEAPAAGHWDYMGADGPDHWANLARENAICATGAAQSPIDLARTQPGVGGRTDIRWERAPLVLRNTGHTIQADVADGGSIDVDGVPFTLVQFHFHAPAEHTVEGRGFAMETHFVHRSTAGELAVVAVLHDTGASNAALAPLWAALPVGVDDRQEIPGFDPKALLPVDRSMYRYAGSLTTPPCTEGVRWQVIQTPTTVADEQVQAFNAIIAANARPVQPRKARDVLRDAIYKLILNAG